MNAGWVICYVKLSKNVFPYTKGGVVVPKMMILAFFVAYGLDLIRYFGPDSTGKIL
jgi:hypothetical protein